jgi:hypothetical protein
MRAMRFSMGLSLLLLAACDRGEPPSPSPATSAALPAASASAATRAATLASSAPAGPSAPAGKGAEAPPKPELLAFQGKIAGQSDLRIALERTGSTLEGVYTRSGEDVPLRGEMKDASRFTVTEVVPKGKKPATIEGRLDGARLVGTWKEGATSRPFTAGPLDPFGSQRGKLDLTYLGSLGSKIRIRMRLTKNGSKLEGAYRYTRSKDDLRLEGTVSETDGKLDLRETNARGVATGRFQGVFLEPGLAFGRWSTPDGARSMLFSLRTGDAYPEIVALPGGAKIVPQEDYRERGPYCTASILYPQVTGSANKALEKQLDKALRAAAGDAELSCEGASDALRFERDTTYRVTAVKPTRFAVELHFYDYEGGAHGMSGIACDVADREAGTLTPLTGKLLGADARKKLDALVNAALRTEHGVTKLTDAGFNDDEVSVGADTSLCVDGSNLVVQFQAYEIAPYAMGAPRAVIKAADAKAIAAGTELAKLLD